MKCRFQKVHSLGMCDYDLTWKKESLQMYHVKDLPHEVILGHPGGLKSNGRVLIRESRGRFAGGGEGGLECGSEAGAGGVQPQPGTAGTPDSRDWKRAGTSPPLEFSEAAALLTPWSPEPRENKFLLFQAPGLKGKTWCGWVCGAGGEGGW